MKRVYTQSEIKRGEIIRYFRRRRGLTQIELGAKLDVSDNTVSDWEQGRKPSVKHWHQLCRELDIPFEWLDEDLTDPASARTLQIAFIRKLNLPEDVLQKLEEAIDLYYREE